MATKALSFNRSLPFGQLGESKIALWLRARGHYVLPAYEKEIENGKGPRLFCPNGELVVPDMLVFRGKEVNWIEAKHKSVFSWYRIGQRWVTGVDERHYLDYLEVARLSPWPVWVLFLHEKDRDASRDEPWPCPTGLFGQNLDVLKGCISHTSPNWGKGMVYWARESLMLMATLERVNQVCT